MYRLTPSLKLLFLYSIYPLEPLSNRFTFEPHDEINTSFSFIKTIFMTSQITKAYDIRVLGSKQSMINVKLKIQCAERNVEERKYKRFERNSWIHLKDRRRANTSCKACCHKELTLGKYDCLFWNGKLLRPHHPRDLRFKQTITFVFTNHKLYKKKQDRAQHADKSDV